MNFVFRLWEDMPEVGVGRHVKQKFGKYFVHLADLASHPRILRTHLPVDKAPVHPKSKIIYISRNPFDTAVSLYKENKSINEFTGEFEDFFTYFLHGQTDYNDYFEHHTEWANRKTVQHMLWITYEELKQYPRTVIKKLGDYLGGIYERNAYDDYVVKEVIANSSLSQMKQLEPLLIQPNPNRLAGFSFFQDGAVGSYKKTFTKEQIWQMSERFRREFSGTSFQTIWKKYGLPISKSNVINNNNNSDNDNNNTIILKNQDYK